MIFVVAVDGEIHRQKVLCLKAYVLLRGQGTKVIACPLTADGLVPFRLLQGV